MRISVFGLGYVGAVSAACFARNGHEIVGVDTNASKVQSFNAGRAPVVEPGLDDLMAEGVGKGRIRATSSVNEAVNQSDVSIVCVGTPSRPNGSLNLDAVQAVSSQIGTSLKAKDSSHLVVLRSTVLPGTVRNIVLPALERSSGKRAGENFSVVHNPEFLRESSAIKDFDNPPVTVIGAREKAAGEHAAELYRGVDAPLVITSIETSEMVKYTANVWHALKVCFGNEIGNVCKAIGIDGHEVMDIFCRDTKLNISPAYLKPGFAFGGSCLPKDTRAIAHLAKSLDLDIPVISSILPSNAVQIERAAKRIMALGRRRVAVLGFSFKAGTDDLRESPQIELIERLIGKGYDLRLYDRSVNLAALTGANRDYIRHAIPHINSLMVESLEEAVAHGEVVVIGNNAAEFTDVPSRLGKDQILIDLVRISGTGKLGDRYDGINW
ncbi:MAG: nucleotide sugar dehydrogenase [Methyloceanibacter sp.]|uniref:nucleotide sugar dehydrogenase n=1 Tax=Methyloceanibacter sp. TaxID=1965321 RepID=UPI003D6D3366